MLEKQRAGYHWARIGFATRGFERPVRVAAWLALMLLAVWLYLELPDTPWRLIAVPVLYGLAALLYLNLGVWLHEQLHCLAFRFSGRIKQTRIMYGRRNPLVLTGHYAVQGPLDYQLASRALLGPLILSGSLLLVGIAGYLLVPGWWLPLVLSFFVVSLLDMMHDLYMVARIRMIGDGGRFWDRGKFLDVVWRDEANTTPAP